MHLINAVVVARMAARGLEAEESGRIEFGSVWWFVYAGISCFLVVFAGIMSGLTLGLMSLGLVDLEILQRSGTSAEKKQAGPSLPQSYPQFCAFNCLYKFLFVKYHLISRIKS